MMMNPIWWRWGVRRMLKPWSRLCVWRLLETDDKLSLIRPLKTYSEASSKLLLSDKVSQWHFWLCLWCHAWNCGRKEVQHTLQCSDSSGNKVLNAGKVRGHATMELLGGGNIIFFKFPSSILERWAAAFLYYHMLQNLYKLTFEVHVQVWSFFIKICSSDETKYKR